MNIDIANIISEQIKTTDWFEHIMTFIAVFLGASLAYRSNIKVEMRKANRQMRGDFCALSTQLHLNLEDMLTYKKNILDKIKTSYENNQIEAISTIVRGPMVSFSFDMDKYIFLNDCNRCFIPEMKIIQSTFDTLSCLWRNYTEQLFSAKPLYQQGNKNIFDDMSKTFLFNYELYNKLCIRLYYLEQHFNECYKRFFNIYYYDDKEDEGTIKIEEYIPDALHDKEFIAIAEFFDKYWHPDSTLVETLRFQYRKLKHHIKCLKIYFLGREGKKKSDTQGKK